MIQQITFDNFLDVIVLESEMKKYFGVTAMNIDDETYYILPNNDILRDYWQ